MYYQFFITICKEALDFRSLVNLNIPQQYLVFDIPDLEFFCGMRDKQVRTKWYFKYIIVDYHSASPNHKKLLSSLNSMEGDRSLIAIAYTSISIIVCQIFDDKFLAYIDNFMHSLACDVDQFDSKFTWTHPQYLWFLIET